MPDPLDPSSMAAVLVHPSIALFLVLGDLWSQHLQATSHPSETLLGPALRDSLEGVCYSPRFTCLDSAPEKPLSGSIHHSPPSPAASIRASGLFARHHLTSFCFTCMVTRSVQDVAGPYVGHIEKG